MDVNSLNHNIAEYNLLNVIQIFALFFLIIVTNLLYSLLSVVECKITSFTGVSGIVIRETAETFGIITQDDKFRGNLFVILFRVETTYDFIRSLVHLLE